MRGGLYDTEWRRKGGGGGAFDADSTGVMRARCGPTDHG